MDQAVELPRGVCTSCGAPLFGRFCVECGQPVLRGQHTVRTMIGGIVGRVLNLEAGFLHTALRLTLSPERVVREYLGGRTVPYTHPFAYLLVGYAAFTIFAQVFGAATGESGGANRLFVILLVPFVAGAARIIFWGAGLNYAEHLIFSMFIFGHIALLLGAMHVAVPLLEGDSLSAIILAVTMVGAGFGYIGWAFSRTFPRRPVLAALGGLVALAAGTGAWAGVVVLVVPIIAG